jgi:BirA family biotin operon repressor/biotin-[acetyl-CoA-carboxylase] ligase
MITIPADLAAETIQARLRSRVIGRPLEVLAEIGSTNDYVMGAGHRGAPEGLTVLADRQTAGRGRRGRPWSSPAGVGLYTSVLLRPSLPAAQAPLLTLMAGLAVGEAIHEVTGLDVRLKWPNDVLVEGRKVAGILVELATTDAWVRHVVVGIGINVNHGPPDLPEAVRETATSLCLVTGRVMPRAEVAAAIYNSLDRWYRTLGEGSASTILERSREQSATLGKPVEVITGEERWRGLAVDLDDDGALLVRDEGGALRRVVAGEVSIRSPGTHMRSTEA